MQQTAILVRPADLSELDHLARLWHEGWHDAHATLLPAGHVAARTVGSFRARLAAGHPDIFVAGPPGAPLGLFVLRGDQLWQFYLARAARGTGFAAALMGQAEAELLRRGVSRAWLDCAAGNTRAARFYEKSGWTKTRAQVERLETPDGVAEIDVWIFEKALNSSS